MHKIISGFEKKYFMLENENVLVRVSQEKGLSFTILVDFKSYPVEEISIIKSKIPVREPTTRGGVYFTDVEAYKIKAVTSDLGIKSEIPKLMLGPNTDFKPVLLKTTLGNNPVSITSHLTNAVNTKNKVELNLVVDKVDLA